MLCIVNHNHDEISQTVLSRGESCAVPVALHRFYSCPLALIVEDSWRVAMFCERSAATTDDGPQYSAIDMPRLAGSSPATQL